MDNKKKKGASIGTKLYIFIIITVLASAVGTAFLSYRISANQIDRYYKQVSFDTAKNFSAFVDGDYLEKLRAAAESEEFQALRNKAEETDDESLIRDYLIKHDLWEGYEEIRHDINRYLDNMSAVRYLYIVACGDSHATVDMYLVDELEIPLYETGYYEQREKELLGIDLTKEVEPTISTGDWGWLCSAYAPVRNSKGETVAQVGCDFGMEDMMAERHRSLSYIITTAVLITLAVLAFAVWYITRIVIRPLDSLTAEMKKFSPDKHSSYEEAGVANLDINSDDEVQELYTGIRSMQVNIIDYLIDLDELQKDKQRAEENLRERDEKIGEISKEAYRDSLTGVGSKAAYARRIEELTAQLPNLRELGIVMVDMNDLKGVNDRYGHNMGDQYIRGCCGMICEVFKHSPVFRIGGDEFVALLQGQDYQNRTALVQKLKDSYLDAMKNEKVNPWERYSAAVGMAELSADDTTIELMFKRADRAMYSDKKKMKEMGSSGS